MVATFQKKVGLLLVLLLHFGPLSGWRSLGVAIQQWSQQGLSCLVTTDFPSRDQWQDQVQVHRAFLAQNQASKHGLGGTMVRAQRRRARVLQGVVASYTTQKKVMSLFEFS